ncbi:MAG TPA: hypothetical protein VJA47_05275 [archaeon]|nr:hypothetical protein [archaeon]
MAKGLPRANWPSGFAYYRVVQIYLGRQPYFRFQDEKNEFHSRILGSTLKKLGIAYKTVRGMLSEEDIPAPKGKGYRAPGMGRAMVNPETKHVLFNGDSMDYGLEIDKKHLDDIRPHFPDWTFDHGL